MSKKPKPPVTARNKLMDYLARRDHSELELRQKLAERFPQEEIEKALEFAKESGWMPDPAELAEKVARRLDEKGRGYLYIRQYLARKGLPNVDKDPALEYKKGRDWIETKLADEPDFARRVRFLKNRGFDDETIGKVLNEIS